MKIRITGISMFRRSKVIKTSFLLEGGAACNRPYPAVEQNRRIEELIYFGTYKHNIPHGTTLPAVALCFCN